MIHLVVDRCTNCGAKLTEADLESGILESYSYCLCRSCVKRMRRRAEAKRRREQLRRKVAKVVPTHRIGGILNRRIPTKLALLLSLSVFCLGLLLIAVSLHQKIRSRQTLSERSGLLRQRAATPRPKPPKDRLVELLELRRKMEKEEEGRKEHRPKEEPVEPDKGSEALPPEPKVVKKPPTPTEEKERGSEALPSEPQPPTDESEDIRTSHPVGAEAMRWKRTRRENRPTESSSSAGREKERPSPPKKKPFQARVDEALKRGVEWLLAQQREEGCFGGRYQTSYPMGNTAICVYALLSAGVKPDSEAVEKAFQYLKKLPMKRTYSVSLLLLAIDALLRRSVMEEGRLPKKWRTEVVKKFRKSPRRLRELAKDAAKWLVEAQIENGLWTYTKSKRARRTGGDMSNTQFALLALDAALRLGIAIPKEVFKRSLNYLLKNQQKRYKKFKEPFYVPAAELSIKELQSYNIRKQKDRTVVIKTMFVRGFGYTESRLRKDAYLTMTAAGLADLVICKGALEKAHSFTRYKKRCDAAIRDAAAYIAKHFSVNSGLRRWATGGWTRLTGSNGWGDYYHLYSIGRAGTMAMLERFGGHNWYVEGAEAILKSQLGDGSWENSLIDTSFALLFLARAVVPPADVHYTGEGLLPKKKK